MTSRVFQVGGRGVIGTSVRKEDVNMSDERNTMGNRFSDRLSEEDLVGLLRVMVRIREFEDQIYAKLLEGLVPGTTHLCQGQEAVSAGAIRALRDDDYISYTYRGHGHCIARGMSPEEAFAELFGRSTGVSRGLGGSMHLTDPALNLLGSFGIIGAGMPFAVGTGLSAQLQKRGQVSITFFGDGATNIGAFHESLNMAAVWKLPVIFVCENNLYGEYSPIERTTPFRDLARRADSYAMSGIIVDGNDVLAVYDEISAAVERARAGEGPSLVECKTYRQGGHSRTDPGKYRPDAEVKAWLARDPILLYREVLAQRGILSETDAAALLADIRSDIKAAAARAAEAPLANAGPRELMAATYA
jgi:pyruvate dehydrogenase E1 component alpha subunit